MDSQALRLRGSVLHHFLASAARGLLQCACRTSTVSSCAFDEQWRSARHFLSSFYHLAKGGGWLRCSSLCPSKEHTFFRLLPSFSIQSGRYPDKRVTGLPFTARVQRGPSEAARCASKKGNRLLVTFSSAHPSTPSPPSPSSAPHLWLAQAP
jgi:hypothetical protein